MRAFPPARLLGLGLLFVLAASLAACAGDDATEETPEAAVETPAADTATDSEPTATPSPQREAPTRAATPATRTPEGTAGETEEPDATATERARGTGGLAPSFGFPDFESYRYTLRIDMEVENASLDGQDDGEAALAESLLEAGVIQVNGAYVAPDRNDIQIAFGEELTIRSIQVGSESWVQLGEESIWIGPSDEIGQFSDFTPEEFFAEGFLSREDLEGLPSETETLHGIVTRHYQVTQDDFEALKALLGDDEAVESIDEASIDVWLAEEGDWPVKLEITGRGTDDEIGAFDIHLVFEMFDINSPITILPPN